MRKKRFVLGALCIVSLMLMTACGKGAEEKDAKKQLVIGDRQIVLSLDPTGSKDSNYLVKIGAGEMLFKVDGQGQVQPLLAESIKQLNPKEWEIKLKQNVQFWSGKKMNADTVIASLERSRKLDKKAQSYLKGMSFSKQDEYTVRVVTEADNMTVPLNLSNFQMIIHNTEMDYKKVEQVDLTGMYKIIEYEPTRKMKLVVNPNYWGEKPEIPEIVYEQITDDQARTLAMLSGRYHIMLNIPTASIKQFENRKDIKIESRPTDSTQTIYLNLRKPQLQDARVREALSWGLDRKELILTGAENLSHPVSTWIASNVKYDDLKNIYFDKFDAAKANQLLDQAGWEKKEDGLRYKDGQVLSIRLMTWGTEKALGEALQAQWSKLGIKAEVLHGDYDLIQAARQTGDWDASIEAWSTFGNPYSMLSAQYSVEGGGNYGGYNNPEMNELLKQLRQASSEEEMNSLIKQISMQAAKDSPAIYLFPRPGITAIHQSLIGFQPHFRQIENVVTADLKLKG